MIYLDTRRKIPEDSRFHGHGCEILETKEGWVALTCVIVGYGDPDGDCRPTEPEGQAQEGGGRRAHVGYCSLHELPISQLLVRPCGHNITLD
jgi:hypothetical protein